MTQGSLVRAAERQLVNVAGVAGCAALAVALAERTGGWGDGQLAGVDAKVWFALALIAGGTHQLYVAVVWRAQLYLGLPPRLLGAPTFRLYGAGFAAWAFCRFSAALGLAVADAGSLGLPAGARWPVALLLFAGAAWVIVSVRRYFGVARALGADHFDPAYRRMPLVRAGAFRYVPNAMYTLGFGALWAIALACDSRLALIVAGFSHVTIWIHYYCTEKPDLAKIHGAEALPNLDRR